MSTFTMTYRVLETLVCNYCTIHIELVYAIERYRTINRRKCTCNQRYSFEVHAVDKKTILSTTSSTSHTRIRINTKVSRESVSVWPVLQVTWESVPVLQVTWASVPVLQVLHDICACKKNPKVIWQLMCYHGTKLHWMQKPLVCCLRHFKNARK